MKGKVRGNYNLLTGNRQAQSNEINTNILGVKLNLKPISFTYFLTYFEYSIIRIVNSS